MEQPETRHLLVGGLVAMGLDESGQYLLAVSHAGRGVFSTQTWECVARDDSIVYPESGRCPGVGPLDGMAIAVQERDQNHDTIQIHKGEFELLGESDGITVTLCSA